MDYQPPENSTIIEGCRQLSEIPAKAAAIYVFSIAAYGHYLSLTQLSHTSFLEACQLLAFAFFPALPLISILNNALHTMIKIAEGGAGDFNYFGASILGFDASTVQQGLPGIVDPIRHFPLINVDYSDLQPVGDPERWKSWKTYGRLAVLLANLVVCVLGSMVYVRRVQITYLQARYVAVLGFDHRLGWLELGAICASLMSIGAFLTSKTWKIRPSQPQRQSYSISESSEARVSKLIFETALSGLIQDFLGSRTNKPTVFGLLYSFDLVLKTSLLVMFAMVLAYFSKSRRGRGGSYLWSIISVLPFVIIIPVPFMQLWWDISEVRDLERRIYKPCNYRWAEQDNLVLNWWII